MKKLSNLYFLLITCLQLIPDVSPFPISTTLFPLLVILGVAITKEGIEDIFRHTLDREQNDRPASVFQADQVCPILCQDIEQGDLVYMTRDEPVPCDIILLSTASNGCCFLDMASLDGESSQKLRRVPPGFENLDRTSTAALSGSILAPNPSPELTGFTGVLTREGADSISLSDSNLLLRGSSLKRADWAIGCALAVGPLTKLALNSKPGKYKASRMDSNLNKYVGLVFVVQIVLAVLMSAASTGETERFEQLDWLSNRPLVVQLLWDWTSFFILLSFLVPMALFVLVEVTKFVHALFISWDEKLKRGEKYASFSTTALSEQLGAVDVILSDKTGTLTENKMKLAAVSIGSHQHQELFLHGKLHESCCKCPISHPVPPNGAQRSQTWPAIGCQCSAPEISTEPWKWSFLPVAAVGNPANRMHACGCGCECEASAQHQAVKLFLTILAACNSVEVLAPEIQVPIHTHTLSDGNSLSLVPNHHTDAAEELNIASDSPDELALVQTASHNGYTLDGRAMDGTVAIRHACGKLACLTVLGTLHFTADRKRMTVIVRLENDEYWLLCKGADDVVLPLCLRDEAKRHAEHFIQQFSVRGLRVLALAARQLSSSQVQQWQAQYDAAFLCVMGRESAIEASFKNLEQKMTAVGTTGIKDSLQPRVAESIASFTAAAIPFFVLTGDKMDTAIEIGFNCSLLTKDSVLCFVDASSNPLECAEELRAWVKALCDFFSCTNRFAPGQPLPASSTAVNDESEPARMLEIKSMLMHHYAQGNALEASSTVHLALIMEGEGLRNCLVSQRESFLQLLLLMDTGIFCRLNPALKADLAHLLRHDGRRIVLAIGDGANDVSMLRESSCGIGLSGEEGSQAALAGDYTLHRFFHLSRLLFVHGGWSYWRVSGVLLLMFFANTAFSLPQLFFAFFNGLSGQTIFPGLLMSGFNTLFLSPLLFLSSILDQHESEETLMLHPELYLKRQRFTFYRFLSWILFGVAVAAAGFFIPFSALGYGILSSSGKSAGVWDFGYTVLIAVIVSILIVGVLRIKSWTSLHVAVCLYTIFVLGASLYFYELFDSDVVGVIDTVISVDSAGMLLSIVLCVVSVFAATLAAKAAYFPPPRPHQCIQHGVQEDVERPDPRGP